jgi:hypothetical protein
VSFTKNPIGPRNDRAEKAFTLFGVRASINPQFVIPEIKHEFESAAWEDPFLEMGRLLAVIEPKVFDEIVE